MDAILQFLIDWGYFGLFIGSFVAGSVIHSVPKPYWWHALVLYIWIQLSPPYALQQEMWQEG